MTVFLNAPNIAALQLQVLISEGLEGEEWPSTRNDEPEATSMANQLSGGILDFVYLSLLLGLFLNRYQS
jgi:hypothetical protein